MALAATQWCSPSSTVNGLPWPKHCAFGCSADDLGGFRRPMCGKVRAEPQLMLWSTTRMSYIEESLSDGEKIESLFQLHWFARVPMIIWIILAIPTLGITLLLALYEYLKLRSIEQGVTNKRVILKTGFISRHTEEMKLNSIETVEIRQGVMGRMFGFGTIEVTGRGISDVVFKGIDDPMVVKRRIESVSNPIA
ncbi:PH domain-containing protein [Halopseudomonas laoshanensis]|uniref:PH domain-containing protein n=2 Tax=Pseudomonadaceae TaxID=135621 RepID=A0A7V7GMN5_9GAMM|nr:PH domain-containing protein [Halopseudomonas laoshanensis]